MTSSGISTIRKRDNESLVMRDQRAHLKQRHKDYISQGNIYKFILRAKHWINKEEWQAYVKATSYYFSWECKLINNPVKYTATTLHKTRSEASLRSLNCHTRRKEIERIQKEN